MAAQAPPQNTDVPISIIPSVLPSDFSRLGEELVALEKAGVDRIQWDVMDGVFVPNITFGPDVIAATREAVSVPFEAHLMIVDPDRLLKRWVDAGCELVIVHAEACTHLHRTLGAIKEFGAKAAVALNPSTPLDQVRHVLDLLDLLLIMTVNPGFGGQAYIETMEPKIAEAAALIADSGRRIELEVDGGISSKTVAGAARAGARALVAGSALYKDPEGLEHAVSELRRLAHDAVGGNGAGRSAPAGATGSAATESAASATTSPANGGSSTDAPASDTRGEANA